MRILNLYSENIKKIKAIDITPEGDTVVISGANGSGKSSTLDSICMVLGGKKLIPSKPVRDGEQTAKISVDLGEYIITRNWTNPETSYLKVQTKDGANITNAQMILNKLIGDLSFDPLAFTTMPSDKRFDVLRKLTNVDFTKLDKDHKELYEERAGVAKDGKSLKARLETEFKDIPNEVDKVDDIEEIKAQRKDANDQNEAADRLDQHIFDLESKVSGITRKIADLEKEIEEYKTSLMENQDSLDESKRLGIGRIDLSTFDEKIEKYFEYKKCIDAQARKKEVEVEIGKARLQWDVFDASMKEITQQKKDMISNADMPIKGLGFGEKEILFNDIPFTQLSMSEQIRVSVSIAIAMNPRLKVAMIYDGSLLDKNTMDQIAQIAKEKDIQIWIERVADSPDGNCIFIENGEVVK